MITNMTPTLAVYESDVHCVPCAEARFGQSLYDREGCEDSHGERVSLAYDWDYELSPRGEYCGTCGREICEPFCPSGYEIFHCPGDYDLNEDACPDDQRWDAGWYYWACQPGCLPDGDPCGPFETEDEALADLLADF